MSAPVTQDTAASPTRLSGAQMQDEIGAARYLPGWLNIRFELMAKVEEIVDLIVDPIVEHSCWDVLGNDELTEKLRTCPQVEEKAILKAHVYNLVAAGDFVELQRIAQAIDEAENDDFGENDDEEEEDEDEEEEDTEQ